MIARTKSRPALLPTIASWVLALVVPVMAAAEPPAQLAAGESRPLDAATMAALGITESAATEAARTARPESGTWSWTPGQYSYDGSGNITAIGTEASFLYDVTGRLVEADLTRAGATEHREYDYDPFGNRTAMTVGSSSIPTTTSTSTNHLSSLSAIYDAAGNVTQLQPPGQSTIYQQKFDALNTLQEVKASNVSGAPTQLHIYTADDERLWTFDLAANASHWKIRDLDGRVVRDYYVPGTTWTLSRDYIYRDDDLLAAVTPNETLHFSLDHLGTPRVITGADRNRVGFHHYLPFGEEWTDQSGAQEGEPMKFTGHERDPDAVSGGVNGFDYMHARYYSANIGRFLSIDPMLNMKRVLRQPQGWNRYAYVTNNPINAIDPDGQDVWIANWNPGNEALLLTQMEQKTGLKLEVRNGKLREIGQTLDANGNPTGSKTARADLRKAMGKGRTFILQEASGQKGMADRQGSIIKLNIPLISTVNTGSNAAGTFDASMIAFHELLGHALNGLKDPSDAIIKRMPMYKGDTVDYENKIRAELGLPARSQYRTEKRSDGTFYIPFANGPVTTPEPVH